MSGRVRWQQRLVGLALVVVLSAVAPIPAAGGCDWRGSATASISANGNQVYSYHYGILENVNCVNPRRVKLRAATLVDSEEFWVHSIIGKDAVIGAWISYDIGFSSCSGGWNNSTKFGTYHLGLSYWLDTAVTHPVYPYCGGGGGGGGGGCGATAAETQTWQLTTQGHETPRKREPLGFELSHSERRPEGRFLMEEWALVERTPNRPISVRGSSPEFALRAGADVEKRSQGREEKLLVVEAIVHPHNERHIPVPEALPLSTEADWPERTGSQDFWFRAEVSQTGEVDHAAILDASDPRGITAVRAAVVDGLRLRYADERRHRVVVFGVAEVGPSGHLSVRRTLVALPQCCCGTNEPFCA